MTTCKNTILITGPHLDDPGGVANYYNAILPEFRKRPHLEIIYHPIGSTASGGKAYAHWFKDQLESFRAIKKVRPHLVVVNPSLNLKSFLRDALITFTAVNLSDNVVVFYRGWDGRFEKNVEKYFLSLFRMTFARAKSAIVLAAEHGECLKSWGFKCPIFKESTTIGSHIALLAADTVARKDHRDSQKLRVLFMSRVEKDKGIYESIDAIASVAKRGIGIEMTVAGDGGELDNVKKYISSIGLAEAVQITGYLKDEPKRNALFSHDVFCLPTKHGEGMPNSLLEAMISGLAVLTSNSGGIRDFFQDGRMGFYVNPDNWEDIAERLALLAMDRKLCREMGMHNHRFASEHFSSTVVVDRLCAIFDAILSTR